MLFEKLSGHKVSAVFARKFDGGAIVRQMFGHFFRACETSLLTAFKWTKRPSIRSTLPFVMMVVLILESLFADGTGKFQLVKDIFKLAIESFINILFYACCSAISTDISRVFLDAVAAKKGVALVAFRRSLNDI